MEPTRPAKLWVVYTMTAASPAVPAVSTNTVVSCYFTCKVDITFSLRGNTFFFSHSLAPIIWGLLCSNSDVWFLGGLHNSLLPKQRFDLCPCSNQLNSLSPLSEGGYVEYLWLSSDPRFHPSFCTTFDLTCYGPKCMINSHMFSFTLHPVCVYVRGREMKKRRYIVGLEWSWCPKPGWS